MNREDRDKIRQRFLKQKSNSEIDFHGMPINELHQDYIEWLESEFWELKSERDDLKIRSDDLMSTVAELRGTINDLRNSQVCHDCPVEALKAQQ